MSIRWRAWMVGAVLVAACGGTTESDAGLDAPAIDRYVAVEIDAADAVDAARLDAPTEDALDAPAPIDATADARRPPTCPATESCNRFDDDCDGEVDEGACGTCESFVRGDTAQVYLACDRSPRYGVEVLGDACASLGAGYAPVAIDTFGEQQFLVERTTSDRRVHLVGARRTPTGFRWTDDRPLDGAAGWASEQPAPVGDCVELAAEGLQSVGCFVPTARLPFLCEASVLAAPFTACGVESCNGLDDDCDRLVDEDDACGVVAHTFLGHVYYFDATLRQWPEAAAACPPGSALVRPDSQLENEAVALFVEYGPYDGAWLGARTTYVGNDAGVMPDAAFVDEAGVVVDGGPPDAGPRPDVVWRFDDGTPVWMGLLRTEGSYSLVDYPTFAFTQPNEANCRAYHCEASGEAPLCAMNCAVYFPSSSAWFDNCCIGGTPLASLCEREPTIGP